MRITLTNQELQLATEIANERQRVQRGAGRRDAKVIESGLDADLQGTKAELAVALAFDLKWDGKLLEIKDWFRWRDEGNDVSGLEVRSTKHRAGRLILHPSDKDTSPYVFVRSHDEPTFEIVGWIWGRNGKKKEYWEDVGYGRPCYMVPNWKVDWEFNPIANLQSYLSFSVSSRVTT